MPCDLALRRKPMADFTKLAQYLEALRLNDASKYCAGIGQ